MPWKVEHICNLGQSGLSEYGVLRAEREGKQVTVMKCDNPHCREEVVFLGHDMFNEAVHSNKLGADLPPNFWIPNARRS